MSQNKINQLRHYTINSVLRPYNYYEQLSLEKLERLKALPDGYNPKTIELINNWKAQNLTAEEMISKALSKFRNEEYYYSYSPPLLQGNTVDQFLFETKSGFCEHYDSAFTIMMRAAGLPARVVTGYQGGVLNKDYVLVKQSDAHAWSEVWVKNKGWLRVDPTAAVSPLRVESGAQAIMSENARSWADSDWTRKMGEKYDSLRHKWNNWVRDYNAVKQKAVFEVFGFDSQDGKSIALVLGAIMVLTTIIVFLFLFLTRPKRRLLAYDKEYHKFLKVFSKKGLNNKEGQGILGFSELATEKYPELKIQIEEFSQLYLKLRFGKTMPNRKNLDRRLVMLISNLSQKVK
jgi:hypothetical protein